MRRRRAVGSARSRIEGDEAPYKPRVARGLHLEEADNGSLLVAHERRRAHRLNQTATLVLTLCTGRNSFDDIVDLVRKVYGLRRRPLREISDLLDRFEDEGLIVSNRPWRRSAGRDIRGLDIVVVANRHRTPLIARHLSGHRYTLSYTKDYRLPSGYSPHPVCRWLLRGSESGPLRCYRGHIDALRLASRDAILVFEDDAVPNRPDWMAVVRRAAALLRNWDVVLLHARDVGTVDRVWTSVDLTFYTLGTSTLSRNGATCSLRFALGTSLAYLIRGTAARRLLRRPFDGYPIDLLLVNFFRVAILKDSPFDHDRSQGSLTETAT